MFGVSGMGLYGIGASASVSAAASTATATAAVTTAATVATGTAPFWAPAAAVTCAVVGIAALTKAIVDLTGSDKELQNGAILGTGAFGRVTYHSEGGRRFALKSIDHKILQVRKMEGSIAVERRALEMCGESPFVVKYFGQTVTSATTVLIMECLEDLTMAYNRLQLWGHEASVKMHAACVAEGLSFLHQKGVIHRDIKPRNLLLDTQGCTPGICKIADFGSAKLGNRALTFVGTVEYMAPERVRRDDYGTAADWWSLGCVVYELLLGQKMFAGAIEEVHASIINFDPANLPRMCSSAPEFFIRELCVEEPSQRLPMGSGIRGIRQHCWYCGFQWPKLANQEHSPIQLPKLALHRHHNDQTRGLPKVGCGSAEACKEQVACSKATAKFLGRVLKTPQLQSDM